MIGRPLGDAACRSSIEGFREVKESHEAALWLCGLEAVTDGLRDTENLVLAGALLAEGRLLDVRLIGR